MVGLPPIPMLRFTDPDQTRRDTVHKAFFTETTSRGVLFHPGPLLVPFRWRTRTPMSTERSRSHVKVSSVRAVVAAGAAAVSGTVRQDATP